MLTALQNEINMDSGTERRANAAIDSIEELKSVIQEQEDEIESLKNDIDKFEDIIKDLERQITKQ